MTITVLGLLCSTAVLFMYFAYRDSQMIGRLNELEAQVQELMSSSSTDTSQPAGEFSLIVGSWFMHILLEAFKTFLHVMHNVVNTYE